MNKLNLKQTIQNDLEIEILRLQVEILKLRLKLKRISIINVIILEQKP